MSCPDLPSAGERLAVNSTRRAANDDGQATAPPTRLGVLHETTASIAHELNQPLAAIVMNGEASLRWLSRDEPRLDEARENIAAMVKLALRAGDIIQRVRCLTAGIAVERTELDLNEVIEEVVPLIAPDMLHNKASLRLDLASGLPNVLGDRLQLQQVIVNLLINGIQASEQIEDLACELLVRSGLQEDGRVVVTVEDNGAGIDARDFDRVFSALFTTKANGMGIGLSICRTIVEMHGGRIWASSSCTRQGAAFHFALPAHSKDTS